MLLLPSINRIVKASEILLYEVTVVHEAHPSELCPEQAGWDYERFLAMLEMTEVAASSGAVDFALTECEGSFLRFNVFRLEVCNTLAQAA